MLKTTHRKPVVIIAVCLFVLLMGAGLKIARHKLLWNDEYFSLLSSTLGLSYGKIFAGAQGEGGNSPVFFYYRNCNAACFLIVPLNRGPKA